MWTNLPIRRFFLIGLLCLIAVNAAGEDNSPLSIATDSWDIEMYHEDQDTISTVTTLASLAMPLALYAEGQEEITRLPVSYGLSIGTTYLAKELLKGLIDKRRPDAYIAEFGIEDEDAFDSFPSGHTALSFAAGTFLATAYAKDHQNSPLAVPVSIVTLGMSSLTGVLRYTSGSHYPVDIFAGALLGILIGGAGALLLY